MILRTVYVRFYRAFNFDYLRKGHPDSHPDPWDLMDGTFYPYVRLDVDPKLTAVVGANESGKSQMLQAIDCVLGDNPPSPADFCRYSDFFTVSEAMKTPHFGLHFDEVPAHHAQELANIVGPQEIASQSSFRVFRTESGRGTVYIGETPHEIPDFSALSPILPSVFRIDPTRAIPNSVPISYLVEGGQRAGANPGPPRVDRWEVVTPVVNNAANLLAQRHDPNAFAAMVQSAFGELPGVGEMSVRETESYRSQLNLAYDLLVTVGGIDTMAFQELQQALRKDDEGLANAIVARMNDQLENSLNLARWWSQDIRFRLAIAVRDFDIVFTIQDRTGSEYSFAERSSGLKYFLSYLVQFLAHAPDRNGPEILLMDEPDAYLSSLGQQDLLRLLYDFTLPTSDAPGGQVVYVTHSPFLIDKNRADRIRVLDKGSRDEGVRVLRDVGRNHFEPLRTALGGFVGETAFIGNCNLMVEGLADQVYLAGMSELINKTGSAITERLDLNAITLVPAGSASHIPYMTFLARGRDSSKPAVIVLLDGDGEGDEAAKTLLRGGPRNKQLIPPEYILQLKPDAIQGVTSDRQSGPLDIEDLVPVEIGLDAVKVYLHELGMEEPHEFPTVAAVHESLSESTGVFKAIQEALVRAGSVLRLDKLAFARNVLAAYSNADSQVADRMRSRFVALFQKLTAMQRKAELEREQESLEARIEREKSRFVKDRLPRANKADAAIFLERIQALVDSSLDGDAFARQISRIRREFNLTGDLSDPIPDPGALKERLETLKYAGILASQPGDWFPSERPN